LLNKLNATVAIFSLLVGLVVGCAPTTNEYAGFAQAGTTYAVAVDQLLVVAGNTGIDATSERFLQDDALANVSLESYQKLTSVDRERLQIIGRLRAHARLLALYFSLVNQLATSDAPERAQQALGGVVDNLNSIGNQLRGSKIVTNKDAITSVTSLVVGFSIRGMLKDELNKRKDTIQVELNTQEELLKALADAIQHDVSVINQSREQRLIINPLRAEEPISNPDQWVKNRRIILTSQATVEELKTASGAAKKLRLAFDNLVEGKLDLQQINTLLIDLDSILAVAEVINHERDEQQ